MNMPPKKNIYTLVLSCLLATLMVFAAPRFPLIKTMHWKIYDALPPEGGDPEHASSPRH